MALEVPQGLAAVFRPYLTQESELRTRMNTRSYLSEKKSFEI